MTHSFDYTQLSQILPILAGLAAASERLVDAIKNLIPGLSSPPTKTAQATADPKKDGIREGVLGLLAILIGIATVAMANAADLFTKILDPNCANQTCTGLSIIQIVIFGILTAGGSRLWNPLVEWMKAIKDAKKPA
jgi:hypothetical protein